MATKGSNGNGKRNGNGLAGAGRDAAIGEILRRLAWDDTGLLEAVERGLDAQLAEAGVNAPGLGQVDRRVTGKVAGAMRRDATLGRVVVKLGMMSTAFLGQSLDFVRGETAGNRAVA